MIKRIADLIVSTLIFSVAFGGCAGIVIYLYALSPIVLGVFIAGIALTLAIAFKEDWE